MGKTNFPSWSKFERWNDSDEYIPFLKDVYNHLDNETWEMICQYYNLSSFLGAITNFAYEYTKWQKEGLKLFDPVKWFKLQHELAFNLKKAVENDQLEEGLETINKYKDEHEGKNVFNSLVRKDYYLTISRDLCELLGDYEKCWEFQKRKNNNAVDENWRYLKRITPKQLNSTIIVNSFGENYLGLTDYGKENLDSVKIVVDQMLSQYFDEHDDNPLCQLINKYRIPILESERFDELKKYFKLNEDFEHWREITLEYCCKKYNENRNLKTTSYRFSEAWFVKAGLYEKLENDYIPNILHKVISIFFEDLFRTAENEVREYEGLPKIGEGWVRETELFYKIKEEYADWKIIQHARPEWLNGQHFDIYFPNQKIAIEYHGKQHFEPVEFFGGQESFEKQKERDRRKKRLSEQNNCNLIVVKKGYDFNKLKNQLDNFLTK